MVDITSALNTSGEMNILNLITDCIKKEKDENDREIQLFTVINKCDDMNINLKTRDFEFDEEIKKMYDQITKRTMEVYESKKLPGICNFTPLSAIDTYIYRMLNNDPNTELLNMNLLNKFGQNELGKKKWNKSTELYKRTFIRKYFSDATCSQENDLVLTGYTAFKSNINEYLSKDTQYNILINRIKYELSQESILNKNITKNIDDMKELVTLYNDYSLKISVIDQIYKKEIKRDSNVATKDNQKLITDVIYRHIENWVENISDLSNETEESIGRLDEYKEVFSLLNTNILKQSLHNKIDIDIEKLKNNDKWFKTLGQSMNIKFNFSLNDLFNKINIGYSKLQNDYYLNKLSNISSYNEFPNNIYDYLSKLRTNDYDNMEKTIDDINDFINENISVNKFPITNIMETPYNGYIIQNEKDNTIIKYCKHLMVNFDYDKQKIISFLHKYLLNRYIIMNSALSTIFTDDKSAKNMYNAYLYVLDVWLDTLVYKSTHKCWNNLYIINKSYLNGDKLDPLINYVKLGSDILDIPFYLKLLESVDEDNSETYYELWDGEYNF